MDSELGGCGFFQYPNQVETRTGKDYRAGVRAVLSAEKKTVRDLELDDSDTKLHLRKRYFFRPDATFKPAEAGRMMAEIIEQTLPKLTTLADCA